MAAFEAVIFVIEMVVEHFFAITAFDIRRLDLVEIYGEWAMVLSGFV